jgi:hypothetical protein
MEDVKIETHGVDKFEFGINQGKNRIAFENSALYNQADIYPL